MKVILWTALALAMLAGAAPITFTASGTVNATLNGTNYNGATITFTQVTDTTDIVGCGGSSVCSPAVANSSTVTLQGFGTATLNDPMFFFDVQGASPEAGVADANTADIIIVLDPAFASYGLDASLGPIVTSTGFLGSSSMPTSAGTLTFGNVGDFFTFSASTVPEPGSLGLLMIGALGLHVLRSKIVRRGYDLHESCSHRHRTVTGGAGAASGAGTRRQ